MKTKLKSSGLFLSGFYSKEPKSSANIVVDMLNLIALGFGTWIYWRWQWL